MPYPMLDLYLHLNYEWDAENEKLFKVVTAIGAPDATGKRAVRNNGARTYAELNAMIDNRRRWPRTDLYIGTATFETASAKLSKDGFPWVDRTIKNSVSIKSLYIDVDVGKKDTYATTADAEAGLQKFLTDSGMPEPTMIVRSGSGGFHVYWCFDKPLPIAQWKPLADALKECAKQHRFLIDMAVTGDAARILRLPSTPNYKQPVATMCTLDHPGAIRLYTAADITRVLSPFVNAPPPGAGAKPGATTSPWGQNFTANADAQFPKLSIDRLAVICPAIADTLATGGAGQQEPEWANYMFTAAWTSDPVDAAHRLSKGHKDYRPADTDRKLAEKQAALAANPQLGWPKCATFNHKACQTCVLLVHGKSPVNFAHASHPGSTQSFQPAYTTGDPLMPEGYWRNKDNHVWVDTKLGPVDVLGYPILDGGYDRAPDGQLVLALKTVVSGKEHWGAVNLGKQTAQAICEALSRDAHIFIKGDGTQQAIVKGFAMAWMQHLQTAKRKTTPVSLGWSGDTFVFGDEAYTPTGPKSVYRKAGAEPYQRVGSDQPWRDAMKLIYGNTPLEIIVASAFAAPLVKLAFDSSVILSVYSHESGFGKTTAMKLAQAVWAHPVLGMSMLNDTAPSVIEKTGNLNNLPLYWDELKTEESLDDIVKLVFVIIQGRSKARLNRDATQKEVKASTTMFVIASNNGISDKVIHATPGTEAGWLRVFEMQVTDVPASLKAADGTSLIIPLEDNYGVIGATYADFLVQHKATVTQVISAIRSHLKLTYNFIQKERFWEATMTTILSAAHIANTAGLATFDTTAIERYLAETLAELRGNKSVEVYSMSSTTSGDELLAEIQNDIREQHLIVTDIVPTPTAGRPTGGILAKSDTSKLRDVWMQVGLNDGRVLVRIQKLNEWMTKHRYDTRQFKKLLERDYVVVSRRGRIGVGIAFLDAFKGQSHCYDLTPKVPPPPQPTPSRNPSSPSANFGSPAPKKPAN